MRVETPQRDVSASFAFCLNAQTLGVHMVRRTTALRRCGKIGAFVAMTAMRRDQGVRSDLYPRDDWVGEIWPWSRAGV